MQNEVENVNATRHAIRAEERVKANGKLHRVFDSPQPAWWQRYFHWENLTVAGREVKGFVVPQWMAVVLLGVFFTVMGWMYRSVSGEMAWQHDQLVILSTQKQDADLAAKQEHDERALQESADKAWREKMTNQMNDLKLIVQNSKTTGRN